MILVVDADQDVRTILRAILERAGYEVTAVGSVSEALAVAAEELPEALVTEIEMGQTSGIALAKRLRAQVSDLPIVLVAEGIHWDWFYEFLPGVTTILSKPFGSTELLVALSSVIGARGSSSQQSLGLVQA